MAKKQRIEIGLSEADEDISEFINASHIANATLFKMAMRAYMNRQDEEKFDERVKRLLSSVLAERGVNSSVVNEVKPKKKLGFGAKRKETVVCEHANAETITIPGSNETTTICIDCGADI